MNMLASSDSRLSSTLEAFLRTELAEMTGVILREDQSYLFTARLGDVAQSFRFSNVATFVEAWRMERRQEWTAAIIEALTTHETSFFRDGTVFRTLVQTLLPELARGRAGLPIRIWSAACSYGQEPYTIAMAIHEYQPTLSSKVTILATDVSQQAVERARTGSYSQLEVGRGIAAPLLLKYFTQNGTRWTVKPEISKMVRFEQHNLLRSMVGTFEIVLCRNVLIYFDTQTRETVLKNLVSTLSPGGILGLGATEIPMRLPSGLSALPTVQGFMKRTG